MKNKIIFLVLFTFISIFFTFCRTNPPKKVKIIVEHDPVVKNIEERDSMRKILPDTIQHKTIEKKH